MGGASSSHAGHGGAASSVAVASIAAGQTGGGLVPNVPPEFSVVVKVVDDDGQPVAGANVLQGGRSAEPFGLSSDDGSATVVVLYDGKGTPTVVASKLGFRTAGLELLEEPLGPVELVLRKVNPPDNEAYLYGEPGVGKDPSTAFCGHCHDTFAAEFQTSAHASAARDALVQDRYAGVASGFATEAACLAAGGSWRQGRVPGKPAEGTTKCYLGGGVLSDLNPSCASGPKSCDDPTLSAALRPTAFGGCADCHAPGMNGKAGGRDLHEAEGVAYESGVHCDFCHKVADVDLALPPGAGQRLKVQRPSETVANAPGGKLRPVMFGPLVDVPNPLMGASVQPKFAGAEFCAGCHEALQPALVPGTQLATRFAAGLPVHTTYSEWLAGPYAKAGVPCQHCHMPASDVLDSSADLGTEDSASITFGFPRPPEQIRRHLFRGPLVALSPQGPRLVDTALTSTVKASVEGSLLAVDVAVANAGCGHAVPTGDPMRAVLLVVEASCAGSALAPAGGSTLDDVGGVKLEGTFGAGLSATGTTLAWPAAKAVAVAGDVVRLVRPSGAFHAYDGVGLFAGDSLPAAAKGMPIREPVGEATVLAVTPAGLTLDRVLAAAPGDHAYLGDALATVEGQPSRALAGVPGLAFARVLVDPEGRRQVPHHRGVDVASDNRVAPTKVQHSTHRFALVPACSGKQAELRVTLLYRPVPLAEARLRGWPATDHRIGTTTALVAIP